MDRSVLRMISFHLQCDSFQIGYETNPFANEISYFITKKDGFIAHLKRIILQMKTSLFQNGSVHFRKDNQLLFPKLNDSEFFFHSVRAIHQIFGKVLAKNLKLEMFLLFYLLWALQAVLSNWKICRYSQIMHKNIYLILN